MDDKNISTQALMQLHRWSLEIAGATEMDQALNLCLQAFEQLGGAPNVAIFLPDSLSGELILKAKHGKLWTDSQMVLNAARQAVKQRDLATIEFVRLVFPVNSDGQGTLFCLPLMYRQKISGAVILCADSIGPATVQENQKVLAMLAQHVAAAIAHAQLYELATMDAKTKLAVHGFFQIRLDEEMKRAEQYGLDLSVAMLDIDYFKKLNDTHGHQAGDEALIKVSEIIKKSLRVADFCARYGGEEFALILTHANPQDALRVAERIRIKIETMDFWIGNKKVALTISGGAATYRKGMTQEQLIAHADQALYAAKHQGRNRMVSWAAGLPAIAEKV